jgi:hypothetical protein
MQTSLHTHSIFQQKTRRKCHFRSFRNLQRQPLGKRKEEERRDRKEKKQKRKETEKKEQI